MGDQSLEFTPEEAISAIGFGKFHGLVLVFAGLGWISEAMGVMMLSMVGIAVKDEWGISAAQESLLTTVFFGGMLVGSYAWGMISDAHGRRKGFISVATVVAIAGICSAFSPNYTTLLTCRCLLGFGIGGGHVFAAWFLEFIPTHNRGAWAFALGSFWSFGTILEASLVWIIMPRLGWRWLVAVSSFPSLLVLVLSWLTPESPRYLCVKGKITEAQMILENVATMNNTKLPPGTLVSDLNVKPDDEAKPLLKKPSHLPSFFALFSPKLWRTTLLVWFLYFATTFSYYGIVFLSPELCSRTADNGRNPSFQRHSFITTLAAGDDINGMDPSIYRDNFITALADLLGLAISAIIVDKIGRKLSMVIFSLLGFVIFLPLVASQDESITTALLFCARLFLSSLFSVFVVYLREVYPTQVRTTGVGTATSLGNLGSMVCPLVAVGLVRGNHQTLAIVLIEAVIALVGVCALLLPIETSGKGLVDTLPLTDED